MRQARWRRMAYLARYAPGAPTPFLMGLTLEDLDSFLAEVSAIVETENAPKK